MKDMILYSTHIYCSSSGQLHYGFKPSTTRQPDLGLLHYAVCWLECSSLEFVDVWMLMIGYLNSWLWIIHHGLWIIPPDMCCWNPWYMCITDETFGLWINLSCNQSIMQPIHPWCFWWTSDIKYTSIAYKQELRQQAFDICTWVAWILSLDYGMESTWKQLGSTLVPSWSQLEHL